MPFEPGSPAWHAHVAEVMREEMLQPYRWWYLSFAGEEDANDPHNGFLGACLVRARGFALAVELSNVLFINPGNCEVRGHALTEGMPEPPAHATGRLLTYEELERTFGEMLEWPERDEKEREGC